jgi:hypothetical protein
MNSRNPLMGLSFWCFLAQQIRNNVTKLAFLQATNTQQKRTLNEDKIIFINAYFLFVFFDFLMAQKIRTKISFFLSYFYCCLKCRNGSF